MKKDEFIARLRNNLSGLPKEEREDRVSFYSEMIDDKVADGYPEEEVIEDLGTPEEVAKEIIGDTPLRTIIKERVKPKRSLKGWEVLLLVLGFPLWFPLVLTIFILFLSGFIVVWSLMIALLAVDLGLLVGGIGSIVIGVLTVSSKGITSAAFIGGAGMAVTGLAIIFILSTKGILKGLGKLTKKMLVGTKNMVVGKGE
jgi:uncharacterized membrane protein